MKPILLFVSLCFVLASCYKNDKDITTGEWEVISVTPAGTATILITNSYFLNLEKKTFSFRLDVNTASGKVQVPKKGKITFDSEVLVTEVCCDSEFAQNLLTQLLGMTEYRVENDKLIFSGNGEIRLQPK